MSVRCRSFFVTGASLYVATFSALVLFVVLHPSEGNGVGTLSYQEIDFPYHDDAQDVLKHLSMEGTKEEEGVHAILWYNATLGETTLFVDPEYPVAGRLMRQVHWPAVKLFRSREELQDMGEAQNCQEVASAAIINYVSYPSNFYHVMQDLAFPTFMELPEEDTTRIFSPKDFPPANIAGFHLLREWLPMGLESFPLRGKPSNESHCVAISRPATFPHEEFRFAKPTLRHRMHVHGVSQRLAGNFTLPQRPRPLCSSYPQGEGVCAPVKVRIVQRRGTRGLLDLEEELLAAKHILNSTADSLPPVDIQSLFFEDLRDRRDLVREMSQVDALIGLHGAGMTNLMFMHPCSTVTQILPALNCLWRAAEVFEGLSHMKKMMHSYFCASLNHTVMRHGNQRTKQVASLYDEMREHGTLRNQQAYLYEVEGVRVSGAELVTIIRQAVRHNLSCRKNSYREDEQGGSSTWGGPHGGSIATHPSPHH